MTNTPTIPGLYFAKHKDARSCSPVFVVQYGELFRVEWFGTESDDDPAEFTDWSGPIGEQDAERLKEAVGIIERILFIAEEGAAVDDEPVWTKAREFVRKARGG